MDWNSFILFGTVSALCWLTAGFLSLKVRRITAPLLISVAGTAIFLAFIIGFWITLERPPLRTLGETRLWYSLFLSMTGAFLYARWRYRWILPFSSILATVFVCVNLFKPEIHSKALMPALQSVWFVPHVTVYMFAYALLGVAALFAIFLLWRLYSRRPVSGRELEDCDALVRIGWAFLTMGIVMGALWAKLAWGDYLTWDPKSTWSAATWVSYLLYLHVRPRFKNPKTALLLLVFSFLLLQMCWWGINYLPSAQGASLHVY